MNYSIDGALEELAPIMERNRLVVFAGSGVSVDAPSSLPVWDDLMTEFITFCREDVEPWLPEEYQFHDLLDAADIAKINYPARVASALKKKLAEIEENTHFNVNTLVSRWLTRFFSGREPNTNHHLIVSTGYPFIMTSNYDMLIEEAARNLGFGDLVLHSYTYRDASQVASVFYNRQPSVIHVHGTFHDIPVDEIIFTAEDYTIIKRKYPGFRASLINLFTSYSVLFIGYGGSDPHLEDLVEEIAYQLDWPTSGGLPRYFLALPAHKVDAVLSKYKELHRTDIIVLNNYPEMTYLLEQLKLMNPRTRSI